MKKTLGFLSLSVLLFSTFAPSFTYANNEYNEMAIQLLQQELGSLSQTTEGNITQGNNENDSINLLGQGDNQKTIKYNPNGGFFPGMEKDEILEVKYSYNGETIYINNIQIPNRTVTNGDNCKGWMFAGWFTHPGVNNDRGNEWLGIIDENTESQTVYAKWLKFNDLSFNFSGNNIKIMDRNLGAEQTANGDWNYGYGPFDDVKSLGYYYKWGNNHGFTNRSPVIINDSINISDYGINTGYYSSTFQESLDNMNIWGGLSESDFDKQGPCPLGYHIPSITEWKKFNELFYENIDCSSYQDKMTCYSKVLKLPYSTQLRKNNDGEYTDEFRSASHDTYYIGNVDKYDSYSIFPSYVPTNEIGGFRKENIGPIASNHFSLYLYPIRCFENTEPTRVVTIDYSDGNILQYGLHWREEKIPSYVLGTIKKDGYRFNGRYNIENGEKISSSIIIESDISIKAMGECIKGYYESEDGYSCQPHTGTISANGGVGEDEIFEVKVPSNKYIRKGYRFIGWNTSENGDGIDYAVGTEIESNGIKLYAKREKNPRYYLNFVNGPEDEAVDILKFEDIVLTSHTDNVDNNGNSVGFYNDKLYDRVEVLNITGATSLNIKVKYFGNKVNSSHDSDYFLIWTGQHSDYSNILNSGNAIKIFSGWDNYNYESFMVTGDSITIGFKSFENTYGPGFGYHIIVEGFGHDANNINLNPLYLGYEFLGWFEENSEIPFDFENTPITEDKTLFAKWKALEEKAQETAAQSVVYTNETTVTIGDDVQEEKINNSSLINLVSKEVESEEVETEEQKITVKESEIQVSSDKRVEYQGGLEVYLEKTENAGTEIEETKKIEGTAKFSSPVAVKIPITSNAEAVKVQVKHEGEEFGYKGLTTNPINSCVNGEAVNDKYNGESIAVKDSGEGKYALIYTCSASTFVAYTENKKSADNTAVATPSAGGGRLINTTSNTQDQEHNSADINEQKENKASTTTSGNTVTVEENIKKYGNIKLTRGEVAVMTNILLDVFPQLVEGKQELDDVENACSNYADEQKFTKDEKKAITRLCKLSIMGIHADNNRPLEEFLVNNNTTNDEFSKVINRSISTYNEKDLSTVKDALKKLENNEDDVVFGTLYDMFMSIKNVLN